MAEMEDSKLKILIKHMDETNMGVQTLVDQGIQNDTMNDLFMGSMFEMANDNRLLAKQLSSMKDFGLFDVDNLIKHQITDAKERTKKNISYRTKENISSAKRDGNILDTIKEVRNETVKGIKGAAKNATKAIMDTKLVLLSLKNQELAAKKKFAKNKENKKEEYMQQTSFEKRLAGGFDYIGNQFSDMKKSFMSLSDGILGSLGKSFLITLAIVNLIAYFRPVASMIARFFKTTFGPEDVGFFSYIGQNITMFLTAGLLIARKAIFKSLFGPRGFFGLISTYFKVLGKGLTSMNFGLVAKTLFRIFTRLIAIPLLIFSAIKGFFTGFETSMEEGNGVLYSIGMGLIGSITEVIEMALSFIAAPVQLLVDFINYVISFIPAGIRNLFSAKAVGVTGNVNPFGAAEGKAEGGPVKAGINYIVGEEGPEMFRTGTPGTIIPNGAGGTTIINNTSVTNASQSTRNDNSYVDISTVDAGGTVTGLG